MRALILAILALASLPAFSQMGNVTKVLETGQLRFGLSVNGIIEPELATRPMLGEYHTDSIGGGASFGDNYLTFAAAYAFALDSANRVRLPIGIEFTRYSAGERYLYAANASVFAKNAANVLTLTNNIEYDVLSFYEGTGYLFLGAGIDLNYVFGREFSSSTIYPNGISPNSTINTTKDDAWRIGGRATVGIQGDFVDNVKFNITASLLALNLIQLNETQQDLFAPISSLRSDEQFHYMYRLGLNIIVTLYNR